MVDRALDRVALAGTQRDSLADRGLDEPRDFGGGGFPADDPSRIGVDHECDVDEHTGDQLGVGEIGDEQPVRGGDTELAIDQVRGALREGSATVVRTFLVRRTPCQPFAAMSRSTVPRATSMPSRFRCAHILSDPYKASGFRRPDSSGS